MLKIIKHKHNIQKITNTPRCIWIEASFSFTANLKQQDTTGRSFPVGPGVGKKLSSRTSSGVGLLAFIRWRWELDYILEN